MTAKLVKRLITFGVLFSSAIGALVMHSKFNKKQNWQFYIPEKIGAKSILNVGKNLTFDQISLYFGDGAGLIYSLNKQNGSVNWTQQLPDHSPFKITQDQTALYIASFDSHIYKLDKKNGYILWSYAIPDFFWPDTEVVVDQSKQLIFFADRGGYLYALDKNSGHQKWCKKFESIDNTRRFIDGTIHFGFLSQNRNEIIANHFATQTQFTIDKTSGQVVSSEHSENKIPWSSQQKKFDFSSCQLHVVNNEINQPQLKCVASNKKMQWLYQIKHKVNPKEIYQDQNRLYFLDAQNQILSSLMIDESSSNLSKISKNNFSITTDYSTHDRYRDSTHPHQIYKLKNKPWLSKIKEAFHFTQYIFTNFSQLKTLTHKVEQRDNYVEFKIKHPEIFYKNKFTKVKLSGVFYHQQSKEKLQIKGFYYDHNTWKLRAKLTQGQWDYEIKFSTPWWSKAINGVVQIENSPTTNLTSSQNQLNVDNSLFIPLGMQDVMVDRSKDGSPLNQLGHAQSASALKKKDKYRYLSIDEYFNLYQNQAKTNFFRYGPDNWVPSIWKNLNNKTNFAMDINGTKQGDTIINTARDHDHLVMMSIFSFFPAYANNQSIQHPTNKKVLQLYLDYIIARYAASIDIWELANEAIPDQKWKKFVSDYISDHDPYHHPITTNLADPELPNSNLLSIHYYASPPKNNKEIIKNFKELMSQYDSNKAKIISEFGFAGKNHFPESASWIRKFSWLCHFNKIGLIFWNTSDGYFEHRTNANTYLGPKERKYLKILKEFMPPMSTGTTSRQRKINQNQIFISELQDENSHLFYLLNLTHQPQQASLSINLIKPGRLTIINPRTGSILRQSKLPAKNINLALPNFANDLALKIIY